MFIPYLYIKDFKKIKELEFSDLTNLNVILAPNGSGKSAILEALTYIFTDHLEENISAYVRWGQTSFKLICKFEFDNNIFTYEIIGSKSSKKKLTIEGDEKIYLDSEATKKLAEYINPTIMLYSSIAMQDNTNGVLFEKPTERLKKLKLILNMDSLADSIKRIDEDADKLQSEIKTLENEKNRLESLTFNYLIEAEIPDRLQLEKQKEEVTKDIVLKKEALSILKSNLDKQKERIALLDKLQKLETEFNSYGRQRAPKKVEVSVYENLQNQIDSFQKDYNFYKPIFDSRIRLEKELLENDDSTIQLLNEKATLESSVKDAKELESSLAIIKEEGTKDGIELKHQEEHLTKFKEGKCPTCGQDVIVDIPTLSNSIAFLKHKIEENRKKYSEINLQFQEAIKIGSELTKVQTLLKNKLDNSNKLKIELEKINLSIASCKFLAINDYLTQMDIWKKEISALREQDKQYELISNLIIEKQKIELEIESIKNKIEQEPLELNEYLQILYDSDCLEIETVYQKQLNEINASLLSIDSIEKQNKTIQEHNLKTKTEEETTKTSIQNIVSSLEKKNYEYDLLKEASKLLDKKFSAYLLEDGTKFIQVKMNEYFAKSYTSNYEILMMPKGNSIDFFYRGEEGIIAPLGVASGQERNVISMAFRVALTELHGINFMLLDEIDNKADTDSDNSTLMIENILKQNLNQYWIITHNPDTKEYLSNIQGSNLIQLGT